MQKCFVALREDTLGSAWRQRFVAGRAEAEAWYRGSGRAPPPTAAECAAQLRRHMPELLGAYQRACALVGDDALAPQILSQYRPPPAREQAPLPALETLTKTFLCAPIHSRHVASPTVYSAVYRPAERAVDYLWPGHVMTQRIGSFRPGLYVHDYGDLAEDNPRSLQ